MVKNIEFMMLYLAPILIVLSLCFTTPVNAAEKGTSQSPLKVAVVLAAPFTMKKNNLYMGLAVDIWRQTALDNRWKYEFIEKKEDEFEQTLTGLANGEYDVLIGPTAHTAYRSQQIDFSEAFYLDSVGVVVKVSLVHSIIRVLETFFYSVGILLCILIVTFLIHVHIIWFFERKRSDFIPNTYRKGVNFVLWHHLSKKNYISSDNTDIKLPVSSSVRISLIIWIIIAYVMTTLISGIVVSLMTVSLSSADSTIQTIDDLHDTVVGAIANTDPYFIGKDLGFKMKSYNTFKEGMQSLDDDDIGAFLADTSLANYELQNILHNRLILSPLILKYELYAFAFPKGSLLKDKINQSMQKLHVKGGIIDFCKAYTPQNITNCRL
jgi:polar amino acid transport system substrate-binding protein